MATKTYLGINDLPKNVKNIYIGVDGVPKKVIKGYIGIDNESKVFWDDDYDMPTSFKIATAVHYSNVGSTGVSSASSINSISSSTYAAWKAFRQRPDFDGWSPRGAVGQWLQYKFNTSKRIVKITIMNRTWQDSFGVKRFNFQASNDGSTWVTLAECTMDSNNNRPSASQDFIIRNKNYYTYYRVFIIESFASGTVTIGCLNMYEPA